MSRTARLFLYYRSSFMFSSCMSLFDVSLSWGVELNRVNQEDSQTMDSNRKSGDVVMMLLFTMTDIHY
jgi:hypothetical protein